MQTLDPQKNLQTPNPKSDGFLIIENVSKVYQTPKGPYTVLENVNLSVKEGEFICVIGHSGCGKSTLLNMVAGFNQPTDGVVTVKGQAVTEPGPERMVVFQNYSLLPWLSAQDNIHLGVESVYPEKPRTEQLDIVQKHLELVGLTEAANKKPTQLSGGMKQRVAIARALATRPQILILDEPFGALDPITREELQEELLSIWRDHKITVLMITHDIDEALFLADRVVMMTNGPAACIGEDLEVPFSRPRNRARIMEDPRYYELRNYALDFLFRRFAHSETEEEDASPVILNSNDSTQSSTIAPSPNDQVAEVPIMNRNPYEPPTPPESELPLPSSAPVVHTENEMPPALKLGSLVALVGIVALTFISSFAVGSNPPVASKNEEEVEVVATPETLTGTPDPLITPSPTPEATVTSPSPAAVVVVPTPETSPTPTTEINIAASTPTPTAPTTPEALTSTPSPVATATATPVTPATPTVTASPTTPAVTATASPTPEATTAPTVGTATPEATATPEVTATATPATPDQTASATAGGGEISDSAKLQQINQTLFNTVDQAWTVKGTQVTEQSVYLVRVAEDGTILSYEPKSPGASQNVQNTPLPTLAKGDSGTTGQSYAEFEVVFTSSGALEVRSAP